MITQETIDKLVLPNHIASTRLLLKHDLKKFIKVFHFHLTKQQFIFKPFHDEIIKELQDLVFGNQEKQHLMINLPPRYGKSIICQYLAAWGYAINKNCNNIYTSYSDTLVLTFSNKIKSIIESDLFKQLFNRYISKSESGKRNWSIVDGGNFYACSMGGSVTGFGCGHSSEDFAGFLFIDDSIKPEDAKSDVMRKKAISYVTETLMSRLNNPKKTPIIIIAQRLHMDDPCGYIIENFADQFKVVRIPAINEETKEVIWEEKMDYKDLLKIKTLNPFYFYSQYQQQPIIAGGTILKKDWFKYYEELPEFYKIYQSWDTAFKSGESNDYSVGTTWGIKKTQFGEEYYLINMFRDKLEYPQLKAKIIELNNKYKPNEILIEDKASGQSILQELRQSRLNKLKAIKVDKDKESRVHSITALFESGSVYFDKKANYLNDLVGELISFPSGKHDDTVDSISQFLNYMNKPRASLYIGGVKIS